MGSLFDIRIWQLILILVFYGGDSVLAFKTTLLWCLGLYLNMVLMMFYQFPHPFWVNKNISVNPVACRNIDFACPSDELFSAQFVLGHLIYNFQYKYTFETKGWKLGAAGALYLAFLAITVVVQMQFGDLFLYQAILTLMLTSIYLSLTIYFDTELMQLVERIGFIKRTSRALKF